ncbi:hypothetical protein HDU99_002851, partial [Rhizoclosmatium hyalinum]
MTDLFGGNLFLTPSTTSLQQVASIPSHTEGAEETTKGASKRGRKAVNTEPASKRIAQVRSAARAYRERKEKYVADLEATLKQLQSGSSQVDALHQRVQQLEGENALLKQMAFTFTAPVPAPVPATLPAAVSQLSVAQEISPPGTSLFSWSDLDMDQTLTQALFSDSSPPPVAMDTFLETHKDWNIGQSVFSLDSELEALLNTPLPVVPACEKVVEGYLSKMRRTIKAIPSLVNECALIEELFGYYTSFILHKTDADNPMFCRINFGRIQVAQGQVINKCISNVEDMGKVMKLFEAIKKEFRIDIDDVLSNDPELQKIV